MTVTSVKNLFYSTKKNVYGIRTHFLSMKNALKIWKKIKKEHFFKLKNAQKSPNKILLN